MTVQVCLPASIIIIDFRSIIIIIKNFSIVGTGGLEPPRVLLRRILSPLCLPISPHSRVVIYIITENYLESKGIVFCSKTGPLIIAAEF